MKKEETYIIVSLKKCSLKSIYKALSLFLSNAYFHLEKVPKKEEIKINIQIKKNKKGEIKRLEKEILEEIEKFYLKDKILSKNKKMYEYINASIFFADNNIKENLKKEIVEENLKKEFLENISPKKKKNNGI